MPEVFYGPAYVGSDYAFDTTRKAKWIADSLQASPIAGVTVVEPEPLDPGTVASVHDSAYVAAVESGAPRGLAESQGFPWDSAVFPMVLASNGGVVAAARSALTHGVAGSLSSGLHHARHASGSGFCTFNGLAIAARYALEAGARSVLILDLDAHCGGGTASLVAADRRITQIDVSVCSMDGYPVTDRAWIRVTRDPSLYLATIAAMLDRADAETREFDLCLYNAGMDPFEGCQIGGLPGITGSILERRERMVFDWCRGRGLPVAFVLAGGYSGGRVDQGRLVDLHRLTLAAAAA